MLNRASAPECISPAFRRTTRMLFQPFRFWLWIRLAVVAVITGEAGGGGGGTGGANFNPRGNGRHWQLVAKLVSDPWDDVRPYFGWIVVGVVVVLAIILLWIYSDCIYRFILLDSVISGQCRLREGWRRWKSNGAEYFVWIIGFAICSLILLGVVIGVPLMLAYRAGWFEKSNEHIGALIGGGVFLVLAFLVLAILLAIIDCLGRDFLIPVMAFENVDAMEGWRRLLRLMGTDKSAYVVYILMKVVLAMGSSIFFAIVDLIVILILLIPLGLLGLFGYLIANAAGMEWNLSTMFLVAALALLAIAAVMFVVGFVYAPGLVFFQSYTLEFFGARYEPLRRKMYGEPAPVPPSPPRVPIPPWPQGMPGDAFPT